MIKYLKQYDYYSCGPIAIINAMRWGGLKIPGSSYLEKFRKECNCVFPQGSTVENIDKVLRKYFNVEYYKSPKLRILNKHLNHGRPIVVVYYYIRREKREKIREGHATLCIGRTKHYYTFVNNACMTTGHILENTISRKNRNSVIGMLKLESYAWLI